MHHYLAILLYTTNSPRTRLISSNTIEALKSPLLINQITTLFITAKAYTFTSLAQLNKSSITAFVPFLSYNNSGIWHARPLISSTITPGTGSQTPAVKNFIHSVRMQVCWSLLFFPDGWSDPIFVECKHGWWRSILVFVGWCRVVWHVTCPAWLALWSFPVQMLFVLQNRINGIEWNL